MSNVTHNTSTLIDIFSGYFDPGEFDLFGDEIEYSTDTLAQAVTITLGGSN